LLNFNFVIFAGHTSPESIRAKLCKVVPCRGAVDQQAETTPVLLMGVLAVIAAPAAPAPVSASRPAPAATEIFVTFLMVSSCSGVARPDDPVAAARAASSRGRVLAGPVRPGGGLDPDDRVSAESGDRVGGRASD
jgi:hypothetical protein